MSHLYETLCIVRTSLLNVIGQMYIDGKHKNLPQLLKSIGEEITEHIDFSSEIEQMTMDEMLDLGFDFVSEDNDLMLIPAWLFPLVPTGIVLEGIDGEVFELTEDSPVSLYSDSWVDAGFYFE